MDKKKFDESSKKFYCVLCDYSTSRFSQYERHMTTPKHKKITNGNLVDNEKGSKEFLCNDCGKKYSHPSGLCRHKKKCIKTEEITITDLIHPDITDKEIIFMLLKQNNEFKELLVEQNKNMMNNLAKNNSVIAHNTINSNNNNKTFNLQVFLNETCKDAMNITDFVDSLQLQLSDLENVGKNGFVKGITNIIVKNLKALDITQRPVHCSDQKRETMYIKDQNEWYNDSKELPENQKLKKAIKQIAHKNICLIPEWKKLYPDCVYADSRKSDIYNHIVYEAMDHNTHNSEKIIKNIAKEVYIDKKTTFS